MTNFMRELFMDLRCEVVCNDKARYDAWLDLLNRRFFKRADSERARQAVGSCQCLSPATRMMPHDLLHQVVEAHLDLTDGIFGQLAAGHDAATFRPVSDAAISRQADARARRRRVIKRGKKLMRKGRNDSLQSERATCVCWCEWLARSALEATARPGVISAILPRRARSTSSMWRS